MKRWFEFLLHIKQSIFSIAFILSFIRYTQRNETFNFKIEMCISWAFHKICLNWNLNLNISLCMLLSKFYCLLLSTDSSIAKYGKISVYQFILLVFDLNLLSLFFFVCALLHDWSARIKKKTFFDRMSWLHWMLFRIHLFHVVFFSDLFLIKRRNYSIHKKKNKKQNPIA